METLIKTMESIGHPLLYDLCAAVVLMRHLASDLKWISNTRFLLLSFIWSANPRGCNITGHQRSQSITHFYLFHPGHCCACVCVCNQIGVEKFPGSTPAGSDAQQPYNELPESYNEVFPLKLNGCNRKGESSFAFMRCVRRKEEDRLQEPGEMLRPFWLNAPPPHPPSVSHCWGRVPCRGRYQLVPTQSKYNMQHSHSETLSGSGDAVILHSQHRTDH